ncbi:DUF4058 family protein [Leptolyngbya sp. NIES-2104]|uniref:DUF4058 family protein n=1 Tax=Leptolyngbya sp. NIES-2104 TaxID=1552121 RepID=UPI0006EC8FAB|nr:DUF4058 family protein [Leptolyngbya sp. NIES-2104]GAP99676.1 hypothetical protein NIES2104_62420 [Leptolyngbya sp. NIES-2104]
MPYFPGMNPYLEGYLFQDLHSALASRIRAILTPLLRPRYAARLEVSAVQDTSLSEDLGIVYPDVEVVTASAIDPINAPSVTALTPATLTLPPPVRVRIPTVEIRDVTRNRLVTCIEILSYANKRQPGLDQYLQKRSRLIQTGVHLVEIDLIRRGTRPISDAQIPASHYRVTVTRANDRVDVWTFQMQDPLPTIPIPLLPPDPDVPLNLSQAIQQVYEEADYDLTLDYDRQPPPPALSDSDRQWLNTLIH